MSAAVGDIISVLRELNLDQNTLVLFLSDHGPHIEICNEGGSAGILRGRCYPGLTPPNTVLSLEAGQV